MSLSDSLSKDALSTPAPSGARLPPPSLQERQSFFAICRQWEAAIPWNRFPPKGVSGPYGESSVFSQLQCSLSLYTSQFQKWKRQSPKRPPPHSGAESDHPLQSRPSQLLCLECPRDRSFV